jgi:hypothetical protein
MLQPEIALLTYAVVTMAMPFIQSLFRSTKGQIFALATKGYLAMSPETVQVDDVVVIFPGARVPFILRPVPGHFLVVGPCYIHGILLSEET